MKTTWGLSSEELLLYLHEHLGSASITSTDRAEIQKTIYMHFQQTDALKDQWYEYWKQWRHEH